MQHASLYTQINISGTDVLAALVHCSTRVDLMDLSLLAATSDCFCCGAAAMLTLCCLDHAMVPRGITTKFMGFVFLLAFFSPGDATCTHYTYQDTITL
jgi:hypothetical protein